MTHTLPTLGPCPCRPGLERDNCPACEGTGQQIDWPEYHRRKREEARDADTATLAALGLFTAAQPAPACEAACQYCGRPCTLLPAAHHPPDRLGRHHLCHACDMDRSETHTPEATARLNAAAPALLAACLDLLELWEEWAAHSPLLSSPLRESIAARVDEARAAVALTEPPHT